MNFKIIEKAPKISTRRAKSRPGNCKYFIKQTPKLASLTKKEGGMPRKTRGDLLNLARQTRVGRASHVNLKEDFERRCENEGTFFNQERYGEIIDEARYRRSNPKTSLRAIREGQQKRKNCLVTLIAAITFH